jgi:acetylornithine deacetylase/succinyl-diaminopimelate desuccinylase-like protein
MQIAELKKIFSENKDRFVEEWKKFLSFPSIGTDPLYDFECQKCAEWLVDSFSSMGLKSRLLQTSGKPVVYAEYLAGKGPTVSFYGHYDVQPADPLDKWQIPPFAPEVRNGRMFARGAQDNKGQVFYFIKALETLLKRNELNLNLKIFIEGEEESGSKGIMAALPEWKELLKSDVLLVCDTGCIVRGLPTITMGLRGVAHLTVKISGPNYDLHSGVHGGLVRNPAMALARLLSTLHNPDGSIAVEGFYDDVPQPSKKDRELANEFPITEEMYKSQVGMLPRGGEVGYTAAERRGFRPTIELNGIHSGYGGPGSKTIIPSEAMAKLSARFVAGQDIALRLRSIVDHLRRHVPDDLCLEIPEMEEGGPGISLSSESDLVKTAASVLEKVFQKKPVFNWEGASIPVVAGLSEAAGAEPLLIGFGLEEDNIHAPNESFGLDQFEWGFLYVCTMLKALSK